MHKYEKKKNQLRYFPFSFIYSAGFEIIIITRATGFCTHVLLQNNVGVAFFGIYRCFLITFVLLRHWKKKNRKEQNMILFPEALPALHFEFKKFGFSISHCHKLFFFLLLLSIRWTLWMLFILYSIQWVHNAHLSASIAVVVYNKLVVIFLIVCMQFGICGQFNGWVNQANRTAFIN